MGNTNTHIHTHFHSHAHTCVIRTHANTIHINVPSYIAQHIPTPPPSTSDEFKINMFNKCMYIYDNVLNIRSV